MKICLFRMIICAALMRGVCYANSSAPASGQSEGSSLTISDPSRDNTHVVPADDGKPTDAKQDEHDYHASGKTAADQSRGTRRADSSDDGKQIEGKQWDDKNDDRHASDKTTGGKSHDAKHTAPTDGGRQIEGKRNDEKNDDHRVSNKKGPRGQIDAEKGKTQPISNWKEQQISGNHNFNIPANTINSRQSANPTGLASGAPLKTANNRPISARSTGVVPLGGSSFGYTHNHGSVPAILGGPASAKYSMTATINGTAMFHKP